MCPSSIHTLQTQPVPEIPPQSVSQTATRQASAKAIRCRNCAHPLTSAAHRLEINGLHLHVFMNPVGILFEVACFSQAPGVRTDTQATLAHTWFSGYAWRLAVCRNCNRHLGWHYEGGDDFYGLIATELRED